VTGQDAQGAEVRHGRRSWVSCPSLRRLVDNQ
jgi:hypothetical protein